MRFFATLLFLYSFFALPLFAQVDGTAQVDAGLEEVFSPVTFDLDNGPILFPPDARLDVGEIGTVELGVTLPRYVGPAPRVVTLVSHEDDRGVGYRVQIGAGGTQIGVYNGEDAQTLAYDFSKGGFFHIALSVEGAQTRVFINHEEIGLLPLGFGAGRNMPLVVGGTPLGVDSFLGEFHYFRLWDLNLKNRELRGASDFLGETSDLAGVDPHLVAFTEFTTNRRALLYRRFPVFDVIFPASSGSLADKDNAPFTLRLPEGARLTGASATYSTRLHALSLIYSDGARDDLVLSVAGSAEPGAELPPCDPPSCTRALQQFAQIERFDPDLGVTGISVQLEPDGVLNGLVLHFSDGTDSAHIGLSTDTGVYQRHDLPDGTFFAGLSGWTADFVRNVGPIYQVPVPFTDISGRWTYVTDHRPAKLSNAEVTENGGGLPHGNYSNQTGYLLIPSNGGRTVTLNGGGEVTEFNLTDGSGVYREPLGAEITFVDNDTAIVRGVRMEKVGPYSQINRRDASFNAFSGTFNLGNQVPFTAHMFHGHDLGFIDPLNLQDVAPLRAHVFRAPGADSRDFYASYQKIVPFGLLHYPDSRERSRQVSRSVASSHDFIRQSASSVGFSIGVPKVASFGFNRAVQQKMEEQRAGKTMFAETKDIRTERALVVDERHIDLSPEFRSDVLDIARQIKLGLAHDVAYGSLLAKYGTHYSHAMTIGTVSVDTINFSASSYRELYEKGVKMGVKAKATVRNVKLGGSFEQDDGFSTAFNQELEAQTEAIDGVVSDLQPVPVFLDLRPLSDLLRAPYFTDSVVVGQVRNELRAATTAYLDSAPGRRMSPEDIWEPYFFEVAFLSAKPMHQTEVQVGDLQVPGDVFPDYFGRFIMFDGATEHQQAAIAERSPVSDGDWRKIAGQPVRFMKTASQICGELDGGTRKPPAEVSVGGVMTITNFNSANVAVGDRALGFTGKVVPFSAFTPEAQVLNSPQYDEDLDTGVDITFSVRRLPDLDGAFKEMPQC